MSKRLMKTKVYASLFTMSEKKELTNLQKSQLLKAFTPVCMLLIQLASVNVFYSMQGLEIIVFRKSFW